MAKAHVEIAANREGYSVAQVYKTMTVGELIEALTVIADEFDEGENIPVYLSHDNGYTFGGVKIDPYYCVVYDDEDDEEEDY